jgi:hypothetical protein
MKALSLARLVDSLLYNVLDLSQKKTGAIGSIATGHSSGVAEVSVNIDMLSFLTFSEKKKR